MKIIEIPIDKIIPYENNPRRNEAAVEYVANSIKEFGFRIPIVLDKNNVIVCGHTRLKAAKTIGMKTVPCVIADDLSDEQVKAYRLADNKTQELSEWDYIKVYEELADILEIDMKMLGFEEFIDGGDDELRDDFEENKEVSLDSFADDRFGLKCPCCGFGFNE